MKRLVVFLGILSVVGILWARAPYTEIKVGYMEPKAAEPGYLFGLNMGRMIDESLSWSFEANYFQRSYRKETTIYRSGTQGGITPETKQLELDFVTRIIPVFMKLNYEHPLGGRGPFYIRASGAIGWEMVWNNEKNYLEGYEQNRFYHGFGWQVSAGLGFEISSSANFFVDAFYNDSRAKRNQTTSEAGLPTWEELNISGFGIKAGVSIVGFGW